MLTPLAAHKNASFCAITLPLSCARSNAMILPV